MLSREDAYFHVRGIPSRDMQNNAIRNTETEHTDVVKGLSNQSTLLQRFTCARILGIVLATTIFAPFACCGKSKTSKKKLKKTEQRRQNENLLEAVQEVFVGYVMRASRMKMKEWGETLTFTRLAFLFPFPWHRFNNSTVGKPTRRPSTLMHVKNIVSFARTTRFF